MTTSVRPSRLRIAPSIACRGFALAFLLWMLAAMGLMVSGVVALSRSDVQLTSLQRDTAKAAAAARGTANLVMRDLLARERAVEDRGTLFMRQYKLSDLKITAYARPTSALVSLNNATQGLLKLLFEYAGGMASQEAEALARVVVEYRSGSLPASVGGPDFGTVAGPPGPFGVVEDLLRVPGVQRALYDRVHMLVHARRRGSPRVDVMSAPSKVLLAVARGDDTLVRDVLRAQRGEADSASADALRDQLEFAGSGSSGSEYCLDIFVMFDDGRRAHQRIMTDAVADTNGVPWVFRRLAPLQFDENVLPEAWMN